MWKKIFGGFLIAYSSFIIVVSIYTSFYKTPYCEWLAMQYDNPYHDYTDEYVEEFKTPGGSCYNHFGSLKFMTNLIVLGYGVSLVKLKKDKSEKSDL